MQQEPETVDAAHDEEAVAGLAPRLLVVESLPLDERAAAFAAVHDELRDALEGADASTDRPGGR